MRKPAVLFFFLFILSLCAWHGTARSETDEKAMLLDSAWGNFKKARMVRKTGTIILKVWPPHLEYQAMIRSGKCVRVATPDRELAVTFDEVWVAEDDEHVSPSERRQKRGKLNHRKLFWQDGKVQCWTLEKYYAFDPVTKAKVGKHQITQLADREEVLKGM